MKPIIDIERFLGLDLRPGARKAGLLDTALNVVMDSRGSAVRRPGLVLGATLPVGTVGLYGIDDVLRAAAPNGTSTAGLFPTIALDFIEPAGALSGRCEAIRLPSGRRLLWIEGDGGGAALHVTARATQTVRTGSRIALDFAPRGLVFAEGRGFVLDPARGLLLWSGVADPDENDGEGYIRTWAALAADNAAANGGNANVAQSGSEPRALGEYRGQLAVLGLSAVSLYAVSAENGVEGLDQSVPGPGVRHAGTVATVSGDLMYADSGGRVRNLSTDTQTAGAAETAVGDAVADLVAPLVGFNVSPVAIYARSLGLYLLGQGTTMVALAMLPGIGRLGWSAWSLPLLDPIAGLAEVRGTVYLRAGNRVYSFAQNAPDDEITHALRVPIPATVRTVPTAGQGSPVSASLLTARVSQVSTVRVFMDGRAGPAAPAVPTGVEPIRRRGLWPARRHAVEIATTAAAPGWRVDDMTLE